MSFLNHNILSGGHESSGFDIVSFPLNGVCYGNTNPSLPNTYHEICAAGIPQIDIFQYSAPRTFICVIGCESKVTQPPVEQIVPEPSFGAFFLLVIAAIFLVVNRIPHK